MIPTIPENAPFSREQRAWLNGYFAGLYSVQSVDGAAPGAPAAVQRIASRPVTVLFGSQTGTAEGLARKVAKKLKAEGLAPRTTELDAVRPAELGEAEYLLVVTSTYGDGEMPDNAQSFWNALADDAAPRLEHLSYSVCALGDSSYPDFCQAGRDLDARLEALGAQRIHPRADCDVDFEDPFAVWLDGIGSTLAAQGGDGAVQPANLAEAA